MILTGWNVPGIGMARQRFLVKTGAFFTELKH
jgi:hypothetical protein